MESELLKKLWLILFRVSPDKAIPAEWLRGYAPIDFVTSIRKRGELSISDAVKAAQTSDCFQLALTDTLNMLKDDWISLSAAAKSDIHQLAKNPAFAGYLTWIPQLTPEDEEDLRIKWYVADAIYEPNKQAGLRALIAAGFDRQHQSLDFSRYLFQELVAEVRKIFQELARLRMEADLAVVALEVGSSRFKYFEKITRRARAEVNPLLWDFQNAIRELVADLCTLPMVPSTGKLNNFFALELQEPLESVFGSLSTLQPNPNFLKEVREILSGDLKMTNITLTGVTGNTIIGEGSVIQSYAQQINVAASVSEEERKLKQALVELRKAIEASPDLSQFQKKSSVVDLDMLTTELSKPADQRDEASAKGFWSRLRDTVSISAGLTTMAMAIGKILGLIS